jgi:hypothetical protein
MDEQVHQSTEDQAKPELLFHYTRSLSLIALSPRLIRWFAWWAFVLWRAGCNPACGL